MMPGNDGAWKREDPVIGMGVGGGGGESPPSSLFHAPLGDGGERDRQTQTQTETERQRAPVRILIVSEEVTRATSLPSQSVLVLIAKQQLHVFTICLSLRCVDSPVSIVRVG